jgi:hypothetical protein
VSCLSAVLKHLPLLVLLVLLVLLHLPLHPLLHLLHLLLLLRRPVQLAGAMQSIMEVDDQQFDLKSEDAFLSQLESVMAALQHVAEEELKLAGDLAAAREQGELLRLQQRYQATPDVASPAVARSPDDQVRARRHPFIQALIDWNFLLARGCCSW